LRKHKSKPAALTAEQKQAIKDRIFVVHQAHHHLRSRAAPWHARSALALEGFSIIDEENRDSDVDGDADCLPCPAVSL
jgi:hypothetical protein